MTNSNDIEIGHASVMASAKCMKQAQEWRPIETAPKDGTRVLLLGRGMRHADGHWEAKAYNGNGCWVWPYVKSEPQKWMPLYHTDQRSNNNGDRLMALREELRGS